VALVLLGSLACIWRYPVKSLAPEPLERAVILRQGLEGDRTAALFVRSGHVRAGKTYRGKENQRLHRIGDFQGAAAAARRNGAEVEMRQGQRYFDDAPVSLLADRWLDGVSAAAGYPVEALRFRPNFFVRSAEGWNLEEPALTGRRLRLGDAVVRVRSPIERCVVVTYDPGGDATDPVVLRYLAERRNASMGIYCDVERAGSARIGDDVVLLEGA
jgi:uncharacterized protein YcbX